MIDSKDIKLKDYMKMNVISTLNSPKYLGWRHKNYIKLSDCGFYEGSNYKDFKNTIGKHNFAFIDSENTIWFCWAMNYNDNLFFILSSKISTRYEIVYSGNFREFTLNKTLPDIIINFSEWILKTSFGITSTF